MGRELAGGREGGPGGPEAAGEVGVFFVYSCFLFCKQKTIIVFEERNGYNLTRRAAAAEVEAAAVEREGQEELKKGWGSGAFVGGG